MVTVERRDGHLVVAVPILKIVLSPFLSLAILVHFLCLSHYTEKLYIPINNLFLFDCRPGDWSTGKDRNKYGRPPTEQ